MLALWVLDISLALSNAVQAYAGYACENLLIACAESFGTLQELISLLFCFDHMTIFFTNAFQ